MTDNVSFVGWLGVSDLKDDFLLGVLFFVLLLIFAFNYFPQNIIIIFLGLICLGKYLSMTESKELF